MIKIFNVDPIGKPRMTQRDKWLNPPRQCVERYWAFKDALNRQKEDFELPENGAHIIFCMPMPKSWSKKKRREMDRQPHKQRPDVDNLYKAFYDSLYGEDSQFWDARVTKVWGEFGQISVVIKPTREQLEKLVEVIRESLRP